MHRLRLAGLSLAAVGALGFVTLLVAGSLRHPVDAAAETGPIEYAAIAASLLCLTAGCVLVLTSYVVESQSATE
ncbi:hypothetical protein [Halovivax gelatinilyticus]|uniref:hypothetical protein n=1 Tax=Halovivax gelatinilyticus TaxID=2961597 RepID=UPI0020CA7D16|nr:hypothetical protein [Halovivax gelatinilyticus]